MLCRFLSGLFAALASTASVADALAQEAQRAALVIGNGAYGDIATLTTPANDANDLAAALEGLGFQVVKVVDGDKRQMETAIHKFARLAVGADAALYFYAGHSLQVDGKNYMMPIDAYVALEQDLDFATIPTALPLRAMERSGASVKIAILDASRDNPMARVLGLSIRAAGRPTVVGQGLAAEQVSERMLVALAAGPGAIAAGDRGRNSPFSTALLRWIGQPGLEIGRLFRRVREDVIRETFSRQVPFVDDVLVGDFYFAGAALPATGAAPRPAPASLSLALELEPVEANLAATKNANVRVSPTVRSAKVAVLPRGSEVHVLGKVKGRNWYLVERDGEPLGYVFGELLTAPPAKSARPPRPAGPAALAKMPRPGEAFRDCAGCPEMVVIPAGRFTMGSPTGEDGRGDDEGPRHSVFIARAIALGRYEVTRAEFAAFVRESGHDPRGCQVHDKKKGWRQNDAYGWRDPRFEQTELDPVVCVGWDDARAYVRWLSGKAGREYRLPSESEWEYAARAGTTTSRYWGEDPDQACKYENVYDKEGRSENRFSWKRHDCRDDYAETAPVGGFRANRFGLRDILGNVGEWVADCWNDSYRDAPTDASAWTAGDCDRRVIRGGSWSSASRSARVAARDNLAAGSRINTVGFRVARTLP